MFDSYIVTPLAGVWIEISHASLKNRLFIVTPLVGVWIEIPAHVFLSALLLVTPLVGVWIEIIYIKLCCVGLKVTPLAGVWIEIWVKTWRQSKRNWSLPLRKCELKYLRCICYYNH